MEFIFLGSVMVTFGSETLTCINTPERGGHRWKRKRMELKQIVRIQLKKEKEKFKKM